MSSVRDFKSLNSSKEFNKIYSKPTHCWHTEWFVLFYKESSTREFAFIASKKVGNAVYRNRAKRLLKAHFIEHSSKLKNGKYIFVAKAPIINSDYKKLHNTYRYIYKKLKLYNSVVKTDTK